MTSYCSLTDLKTYLNITSSTEDTLLQTMLNAATSRIDSRCGRSFQAPSETTHYFDTSKDLLNGELWLDDDLSYITQVVNGDGVDITNEVYHNPRNFTPYYLLGFKSSSTSFWQYETDIQNAISVTGRWSYMDRITTANITRNTSVVTATVTAPYLSVGMSITVYCSANSSFDGTFVITANTGTTITWAQSGSNNSETSALLLCPPSDIITACRRLAAWMYRQKDTQQGDTDRPLLAGDGIVIMPTTIPQDVEKILLAYTRFIR